MQDIAKCSSEICAWRNKCYRYNVEPGEYQAWANLYDICKATSMSMFVEEE
jgi:hypothetical protein